MSSSTQSLSDCLRHAYTEAVAVAARHADAVDRDGRIPVEALESLRAGRLLGAMVPGEYGGGGLSLREVANMCICLAQGCAATGLIFAMHQSQAAALIRHAGTGDYHRQLLGQLAQRQWLLGSSTSEAATGGAIRHSVCYLDTREDGVHLQKKGAVISYATAADCILVTARSGQDAAISDQRLVAVMREQYQLQQTSRWNPLGMRGTCTERFDLDAHCPDEQVFTELFGHIMASTILPVAHILLASVWLGIAASALGRAQAFLRTRNRAGTPPSAAASLRLAEAESLVQQMRAMIRANLTLHEMPEAVAPAQATDRMVSFNALKLSVSSLVVRVTDLALRICGFEGYMEEGEFYLSRHIRDAHSAMVMVNDDRILTSLATVALGSTLEREL